jgi:hypothetical protein
LSTQPVGRRIRDFIAFGVDWNDRTRRNPNNPPDHGEFDQFADLLLAEDEDSPDNTGTTR